LFPKELSPVIKRENILSNDFQYGCLTDEVYLPVETGFERSDMSTDPLCVRTKGLTFSVMACRQA